ncbi:hypothetical protein [Thermococcus sp.]|uniref:hypothetical protein n=1 Tax=Thermococcus sp. TaxID=35749 RepID=UPI002620C1DC|nr:hypothetical protein [Thermococcus sp.]
MKRLSAIVVAFFVLTLATASGWWGNGVQVSETDSTTKLTSNSTGIHTAISPKLPANETWNVSFEVKSSVSSLLVEPAYFNGTKFLFAKSPVPVSLKTSEWGRVSVIIPSEEKAQFSALVFIINGTGTVEVNDFSASKAKGQQTSQTQTGTLQPTAQKGGISNVTGSNSDIIVTVILNGTYKSGGTLRADFYITSREKTFTRVDISLKVYYHGIKVFSYSHPSWREYRPGKTVHIYKESRLPILTPPGRYELIFTITPEGGTPLTLTAEIQVKPTIEWFVLVLFFVGAIVGLIYVLIRHKWVLKNAFRWYSKLSIGQRFVLYAVIGLSTSALILAAGAENLANDVAIFVYYLLLMGVLNLWVEYFEPKRDNPELRFGFSLILIGCLSYLSRDTLMKYPAFLLWLLGTALIVKMVLRSIIDKRKPSTPSTIKNIEGLKQSK